jgi:hypothetical protein
LITQGIAAISMPNELLGNVEVTGGRKLHYASFCAPNGNIPDTFDPH